MNQKLKPGEDQLENKALQRILRKAKLTPKESAEFGNAVKEMVDGLNKATSKE